MNVLCYVISRFSEEPKFAGGPINPEWIIVWPDAEVYDASWGKLLLHKCTD